MKKYRAIPTWLLTRVAYFLHPGSMKWAQYIGLEDWYRNQTKLCREFDLAFWAILAMDIVLIVLF